MSIATELFHNLFQKKMTFSVAVNNAATEFDKWKSSTPGVTPVVDAAFSQFKSLASQAESLANTEMGAHYSDGLALVQQGLDTWLLGVTRGLILPAVPVVNQGVASGFNFFRGVIDLAEAKFNASLSIPTPAVPTIPVSPPPPPSVG